MFMCVCVCVAVSVPITHAKPNVQPESVPIFVCFFKNICIFIFNILFKKKQQNVKIILYSSCSIIFFFCKYLLIYSENVSTIIETFYFPKSVLIQMVSVPCAYKFG